MHSPDQKATEDLQDLPVNQVRLAYLVETGPQVDPDKRVTAAFQVTTETLACLAQLVRPVTRASQDFQVLTAYQVQRVHQGRLVQRV